MAKLFLANLAITFGPFVGKSIDQPGPAC